MADTKVTRKDLITKLNEDLSREYQAIIAYVVYSQVLKGAEYMNIANELEKHAGEELQHALTISKHVDYLGGMPVATPQPVKLSEKAEEMLRADLKNESDTIRAYRERVQAVRVARRVCNRRRHPRDPPPGAGAPDRSRNGARRGSSRPIQIAWSSGIAMRGS